MVHHNKNKTHSHFLHLPKFISKSGIKPSKKARINFIIISLILLFCLFDMAISALTMGGMFPGVSIAGHDVSYKTREQTFEYLKNQKLQRNFTVRVNEKVFSTTSDELGAGYDISTTVDTAYKLGRNNPSPLLGLFDISNRGQIGYAYNVDQTKLKNFADSVIKSVGYSAQNATLRIENGVVTVVPDKDGLRVDQKYLNKILSTSLADAKDQNIVLQPQTLKADILAQDTLEAKQQAENFLSKTVTLNFEGKSYVADKTAMGYMVSFTEVAGANGKPKLQANISTDQIAGYVQSIANQIDISPINKKVVVRNGAESVEREGKDGRAINQKSAIDTIVSGLQNNQNVEVNLTSSPVAFKTEYNRTVSLDYSRYIEINLSQQRLWAWQDNQVIFSTPITSGATSYGFGTPTGLFSIYGKERSRYLNGAQYGWGYNVYVDYWMPFAGGVGLHDADWRSGFGGQDYINGGSHGCVNMSQSAAAYLYNWAAIGTPVWVHY